VENDEVLKLVEIDNLGRLGRGLLVGACAVPILPEMLIAFAFFWAAYALAIAYGLTAHRKSGSYALLSYVTAVYLFVNICSLFCCFIWLLSALSLFCVCLLVLTVLCVGLQGVGLLAPAVRVGVVVPAGATCIPRRRPLSVSSFSVRFSAESWFVSTSYDLIAHCPHSLYSLPVGSRWQHKQSVPGHRCTQGLRVAGRQGERQQCASLSLLLGQKQLRHSCTHQHFLRVQLSMKQTCSTLPAQHARWWSVH
jgi:hypothetical protein